MEMTAEFMSHTLSLRYTGPAVEAGRMDSYSTAASIIAFGDYLGEIARTAHGKNARVRTEVNAFSRGSFSIEFALSIGGVLTTLFSGATNPKDVYDLVEQSFSLWKHLRGEPPASVTQQDEHGNVLVENNYGTLNIYRATTLNIISNEAAGRAAERFVGAALTDGVEGLELSGGRRVIGAATLAEAAYFRPIVSEIPLLDSTSDMWVLVESPVFKDGNKWKFADDRGSFFASIMDDEFLEKVRSGRARFGCGDRLLVSMRTRQMRIPREVCH